jgi:hypothetical protein
MTEIADRVLAILEPLSARPNRRGNDRPPARARFEEVA